MYCIYQSLWHISIHNNVVWDAGSVYSRILDLAMKEGDRDFWMSYLDDILTYSGEP